LLLLVELTKRVRAADSIDNPNSFDRVPTYWLPTIRSLGVNVPVILIGNKIDLREGQVTNQALEDGESLSRSSAYLAKLHPGLAC
jgi:GTPase SAR1 family protein